jgi:hypothetical protein
MEVVLTTHLLGSLLARRLAAEPLHLRCLMRQKSNYWDVLTVMVHGLPLHLLLQLFEGIDCDGFWKEIFDEGGIPFAELLVRLDIGRISLPLSALELSLGLVQQIGKPLCCGRGIDGSE